MITFKRCNSPQRGVTYVREVCQLMERCDAQGRSVQELGEVWQLSGSVTSRHQGGVKNIRKVCQPIERFDGLLGGVKEYTWRGVIPVNMLRVYLRVTGEV